MKRLLRYKYFDLFVQLAACPAPLVIAVAKDNAATLMGFYFIAGPVQAFSSIMNSVTLPQQIQHHTRKQYRWAVWTLIVVAVLATVCTGFAGLLLMMVFSPFLAMWYLLITAKELSLLKLIVADGIK